jgi:pyrimidine operon attenuation protein/uracil phosphoribosyltransferase
MNLPSPDDLIAALVERIAPSLTPDCALVGMHTGGVWVMEALAKRLGRDLPQATVDTSFYRDDYAQRGLHDGVKPSRIDFDVEGRRILLIDDVLNTGRSVRAALNLLFDYGRPATVRFAVLVDRGQRELPIQPDYCGLKMDLPASQSLRLNRTGSGQLSFQLLERKA